MRSVLLVIILIFSNTAFSATYLGANFGYDMFSSEALDEYKVSPRGTTYGGFLGFGKDFVGLEFFYQSLKSEGNIKHDGGTYNIVENANAMGAAVRFSFEIFYLRAGISSYTLDQSLDIDDENVKRSAEAIYKIEEDGTKKNGAIYGIGIHRKLGPVRAFVDFTRYQINTVGHYDTVSIGITFNLSDNLFNPGKY